MRRSGFCTTPAAFTRLFAKQLEQHAQFLNCEVKGPLQILVQTRNRGSLELSLEALLNLASQRSVDGGAELIRRRLRGDLDTIRIAGGELPQPGFEFLLPVIKPDGYFDAVAQKTGGKVKLLRRNLVADLWIAYVLDLPDSMQYVSEQELAKREISAVEVHEREK
jgi:hypothetical protein